MSESHLNGKPSLPRGWERVRLTDISAINPPLDRCILGDEEPVNFVPMRAVDPEGGGLTRPESRPYGEVKKGYTAFLSGDVIMAKITPCMENGKTAVAPELPGSVCFGSTEFHTVRPERGIESRWIAYFLLQHEVRQAAQRQMGGAVGQMRVPASFLENLEIPCPSTSEQLRVLETIDELLSDLDAGVAALERVQAKLSLYRAAILKAAVEGKLTADWRANHPKVETASELLKRILIERRRLWEMEQLRKFKDAGKEPSKNWKAKYKEPVGPNTTDLPELPKGWCWVTIDQVLSEPIVNGISVKGSDHPPGIPALRLNAMTENGFDYTARRYLPLEPEQVDDLWIETNDFFVSRGNGSKKLVGRGTVAQEPPERLIFPDTMMRLRLLNGPIQPSWIPAIWSSGPVRQQIEQLAKTTAGILKVSQPDVASIVVPIPSVPEQEAIIEAVEDQLSIIDHLEADIAAKLKASQALRQSILRDAFAGKLMPQDPKDEPASNLLQRIASEREERERLAQAAKKLSKKPGKPRKTTAGKRKNKA